MIPTFAIVATDYSGYISSNGKPVGFAYPHPSARKMDQAFLRHTVGGILLQCESPLVVIGNNTLDEVKGTKLYELFSDYSLDWCIPDQRGITVNGYWKAYSEQDTLKESRRRILSCAMENGCDSIIVLGGVSVYKTFEGYYSCIYHTVFKDGLGQEGDKQWIIPDDYQPEIELYVDEEISIQILSDVGGRV